LTNSVKTLEEQLRPTKTFPLFDQLFTMCNAKYGRSQSNGVSAGTGSNKLYLERPSNRFVRGL